MSVSKNPDLRIEQLKKKYGDDLFCFMRRQTFSAYKDKSILNKMMKQYKIGRKDCYMITEAELNTIIDSSDTHSFIHFIDTYEE